MQKASFLIMDPAEIKTLIENGLDGAEVSVFSEDNTHYAALVISAEFAGQRPIARHQLVYRCLGALMGNEIHAMSIRAHTPEEWQAMQTENGA
jgi:acid stress-induced BolA-like protein IbaG/YrbA